MLKGKRRSFGGMVFIFAALISAFSMTYALKIAYMSQAVSLADNYSKIYTIEVTALNYQANAQPYTKNNPNFNRVSNGASVITSTNPIFYLNQSLNDIGIKTEKENVSATVNWDGRRSFVQVHPFETKAFGITIRPHKQSASIENK